MKRIIAILFSTCILQGLAAQNDSNCHLQISLLTCTPGEELYSTFGHSAVRVRDNTSGTDIIYNYGTFDFNDPSFYSKFIRGKLLYFVSVDKFDNFSEDYKAEQRGIVEQDLTLSCAEREMLSAALQENAKEENRYYKYDFISDNCTTRLRDMVFKNAHGAVITRNILDNKGVTFRNLIHQYLDRGGEQWSKFGIDILLGMPLDKPVSNSEAMFLPDNLLKGFDSTVINGRRLVRQKVEILSPRLLPDGSSWLSPFLTFGLLFLIIAFVSLTGKAKKFLATFDIILFFLTGAVGILIIFMWLGTDHPECANNLNLAWALPFHFPVAFFIYKKPGWTRYYFIGTAILLFLLLVSWKWLPQEMNNGLIPLVCLLLMRSLIAVKKI